MKQEILDKLARLHYEDEKRRVKRLKALLNDKVFPAGPSKRETHLMMLRYHKERLMYHKRMVPMKPVLKHDKTGGGIYCPSCNDWFFDVDILDVRICVNAFQHCRWCGQRLMWSDKNGEV